MSRTTLSFGHLELVRVNPTMTPSGVEQRPAPPSSRPRPRVNPTMTPSGVEQVKTTNKAETAQAQAVNPTMTPSGVEQIFLYIFFVSESVVNPTMTPSGVEQAATAAERRVRAM